MFLLDAGEEPLLLSHRDHLQWRLAQRSSGTARRSWRWSHRSGLRCTRLRPQKVKSTNISARTIIPQWIHPEYPGSSTRGFFPYTVKRCLKVFIFSMPKIQTQFHRAFGGRLAVAKRPPLSSSKKRPCRQWILSIYIYNELYIYMYLDVDDEINFNTGMLYEFLSSFDALALGRKMFRVDIALSSYSTRHLCFVPQTDHLQNLEGNHEIWYDSVINKKGL